MINISAFRICILCLAPVVCGCSYQHLLASNPSLTEDDALVKDKVYLLDDMTFTLSVAGIEIRPVVSNKLSRRRIDGVRLDRKSKGLDSIGIGSIESDPIDS